jgi:hypothetical protein
MTPGGKPAARSASPISRCVAGQISDAFKTTVLLQAKGVATARTPKMTGAFHGAMPNTGTFQYPPKSDMVGLKSRQR